MGKLREDEKRIASRVNLKNIGPTFSKFISICIKVLFLMLGKHPSLICGRDFTNTSQYEV